MQLYMCWYIISFFGFIFPSYIFFIFSSTPVLTSSIDVVFILSIGSQMTRIDVEKESDRILIDVEPRIVVIRHALYWINTQHRESDNTSDKKNLEKNYRGLLCIVCNGNPSMRKYTDRHFSNCYKFLSRKSYYEVWSGFNLISSPMSTWR